MDFRSGNFNMNVFVSQALPGTMKDVECNRVRRNSVLEMKIDGGLQAPQSRAVAQV